MATISRLRRSEKRPDRVIITIDDAHTLSVPLDLAIGLRRDQALDERELAALRAEADYRRALDRCLRFLGHRPRSRAEIERYLTGKAVPPRTKARLVAHLEDLALIDDTAFARWWVENRSEHRPRARRALRHELAGKGVAPDTIAEALEGIDDERAATEAASRYAARGRRGDPDAFERRMLAFLVRRGFDHATARAAIRAALSSPDTEPSSREPG